MLLLQAEKEQEEEKEEEERLGQTKKTADKAAAFSKSGIERHQI
jgi:hypothetical protein